MKPIRLILAAFFMAAAIGRLSAQANDAPGQEPPRQAPPWGATVDGLACRLVMQPRFVIGQLITATIEVKNVSNKKRYLVPQSNPACREHLSFDLTGPAGKVRQTQLSQGDYWLGENSFLPILPGEVKRFEIIDLREPFGDLNDWQSCPQRKANAVTTGKYVAQFRFRSPKAPARFITAKSYIDGKEVTHYKDVPAEVSEGQWASEIVSPPVAFELKPLDKKELVVHEWGVFTVFNDVKYANVNRQEEWGSLPSFFYRQFPKERLRWVPSAWDKPIVYFYAKSTPMHVSVKVTFAEGAPVVWWPAASAPVNDWPGGKSIKLPRPFRSLTWEAWLGDKAPALRGMGGLVKTEDFPLPDECWLKQARLPGATRLTVVGNNDGAPKRSPGAQDRAETESFLYYDGLVPAPDYLRCEKIDASSLTLRNRGKFDLQRLFVVDRRSKSDVGFAFVDGTSEPFKAGAERKISPRLIAAKDWPAAGLKQVRQALLDAGLFEAEADSLLKIWDKKLLKAEGVTVFHLLPIDEYDRMLALDILPVPAERPVRVGIALHPHMEIEPMLAERVGGLIRQLDSANFEKRVAARKELLEIGPLAIGMLRAELKNAPTLEMSRQIEAILERVDGAAWMNFPRTEKK